MAAMDQVAALLVRADQMMRAGRAGDALPLLRQAAWMQPLNPAIQFDVGSACLQTGQTALAIEAFQTSLALKPDFPEAWLGLGAALQAGGNEAAALDAYRQATTLRPSLVEARFRTGALLESHGQPVEAIAAFRQAARSAPRTSLGRLSNARALLAEGRDGEAERTLRHLLALDPHHATAIDLLGLVCAESGRLDEAGACYERATAAAPHLAGSYYELVRCRRLTADDADLVGRMQAALTRPELHPEARLKLHLALGKAADDLDDVRLAMQHFDAADRLRASLGSFDLSGLEERVDRLISYFTADRLAPARDRVDDNPTPLLIVGLPRSGTTLVEHILSCHGQVHAGGELPFWTGRGSLWERSAAGGIDPAFLAAASADYLALLHGLAPGAARVTDKMPLNLFWVGLVHRALPGATIIHCRRSPIDTALSIHRTYLSQYVAFPTGGIALVATIRALERLARHWRSVLPAERFVELEYERLVDDPEPVIRRLVAACGLPWDPACLAPERNPRRVRTPSKWQVRQPISGGSVDRWRRYEPWAGALAALIP